MAQNPFFKLNKTTKVTLQANIDDKVVKKKAGRPRKPNMGRYHIRLPVKLKEKASAYCDDNGLGFSAFIQNLIVKELS